MGAAHRQLREAYAQVVNAREHMAQAVSAELSGRVVRLMRAHPQLEEIHLQCSPAMTTMHMAPLDVTALVVCAGNAAPVHLWTVDAALRTAVQRLAGELDALVLHHVFVALASSEIESLAAFTLVCGRDGLHVGDASPDDDIPF